MFARHEISHIRWITLGALIILVGMLLRFWLYQQPMNSDDISYFDYAASDNLSLAHTQLRIAFFGLPALAVQIFGYSLTGFYFLVYTHAILSGISIFIFASVLSGKRTAILTTLFWMTSYAYIEADTRLLPDNIGTSFALIGLAAVVWASRPMDDSNTSETSYDKERWVSCLYALLGGLLLWAAFSVRASFAVFSIAAFVAAFLSHHRWRIVLFLLLGLVLGNIFELLYMANMYGDALARMKILTGYGGKISKASIFGGYTYADIITRYPRVLLDTKSSEFALHCIGLVCTIFWAFSWRDRRNLIKLSILLLSFGFIAYAMVSWDPPVPLMRELLRYYVTAAPLFYLGAAELLLISIVWLRGRMNPLSTSSNNMSISWIGRCNSVVCGLSIVLVTSFGIYIIYNNLSASTKKISLVRNGHE